ncbi:MAG: hypothetical protein WA821_16270 [Anaerolineales bacterium]
METNINGKVLIWYRNREDEYEAIYVDVDVADFVNEIQNVSIATPTPQP